MTTHNMSKENVRRVMSLRRVNSGSTLKCCPEKGCGAAVLRLDTHLKNVHKIFPQTPAKFGMLKIGSNMFKLINILITSQLLHCDVDQVSSKIE